MENDSNIEGSLSIIVVEDNPGDFILIEDNLIEMFTNVLIKQYPNFKSAANFLKSEDCKCDLILLDLHLPDMGGIELIKNMIALSCKTPIIILTGYGELPLAKKSLELGVYDFLVKDEVNPTLLHKSIEFALSRSSYFEQIENQNEKLRNIAWTQSHVVRAPLARMLGIIDMIESLNEDTGDLSFWLDQLKTSSKEMDEIVRNIVKETQTLNINK
jgi:FixJ family two-component response regulator